MAIFAATFFFGKIGQENVFYAILQRKNAFLGYKNKKIEKSKNCYFSKGVNPWFQFKNGHFFNFLFLDNKGQGNVFYDILERKTPFQAIKTIRSKSRDITIFPKGLTHGFGPKMPFFPTSLFLGSIGQENFFYYILQRKNAFLDYKNKKFKMSKNCHFSYRVNPWFWSKNDHFSNFFLLGKIGQGNVFYNILKRKNAFLGDKNKKFKKSKNCLFSKKVN